MSENHYFKQPIPADFRIFVPAFEVPMAKEYAHQVDRLVDWEGRGRLYLESEPGNKYDSNAILILGSKKGLLWSTNLVLGYVPRDLARKITRSGWVGRLLPRPKSMWRGDRGGFSFEVDLLGKKSDYTEFKSQVLGVE